MKHNFLLLLAALMMWCPKGFAQSSDNEDEVVKIDKWNQGAYREGEVIVHFREDSRVQMRAGHERRGCCFCPSFAMKV